MSTRPGEGKAIKFLRSLVGYQGDECVPWPMFRDPGTGRGRMGYMGKGAWSHRVMCELAHGPAPADKPQVAHSCGKGHDSCVNHRHLSWSNQSDNHKDRRRHGTARTNAYGSRSRLTLEQIEQIRALKGKQAQMTTARQFGISHANVRYWQGERDKYCTKPPNARQSA